MMLKDHKQLPQAKGVWVFAHKYVQYLCICHDSYTFTIIAYTLLGIIHTQEQRPKHLCHKKQLDLCHFNIDFYYIFLSLLQLYQCILLYTTKPFLFLLQEPLKNFCTVSGTN